MRYLRLLLRVIKYALFQFNCVNKTHAIFLKFSLIGAIWVMIITLQLLFKDVAQESQDYITKYEKEVYFLT